MTGHLLVDVGRLRPVWPWLALGSAAVVAGGLVAAVVAHDPSEKPVWATAYLVLVAGVGQLGLALGRALLSPRPPTYAVAALEFGVFCLGNAGVVLGTLTDTVWLTDVGGALLVLALGLIAWAQRPVAGAETDRAPGWQRALGWGYRLLVMVLLVSIPVGLLLARR